MIAAEPVVDVRHGEPERVLLTEREEDVEEDGRVGTAGDREEDGIILDEEVCFARKRHHALAQGRAGMGSLTIGPRARG